MLSPLSFIQNLFMIGWYNSCHYSACILVLNRHWRGFKKNISCLKKEKNKQQLYKIFEISNNPMKFFMKNKQRLSNDYGTWNLGQLVSQTGRCLYNIMRVGVGNWTRGLRAWIPRCCQWAKESQVGQKQIFKESLLHRFYYCLENYSK